MRGAMRSLSAGLLEGGEREGKRRGPAAVLRGGEGVRGEAQRRQLGHANGLDEQRGGGERAGLLSLGRLERGGGGGGRRGERDGVDGGLRGRVLAGGGHVVGAAGGDAGERRVVGELQGHFTGAARRFLPYVRGEGNR